MNGALQRILSIRGEGAYNPGQCPDSPCLQCGEEPTTTTTTTTLAPATRATVCQPDNADNFSMVYYPPDQEITGAYMQGRRGNDEYGTRFDIRQRWIIALGKWLWLPLVDKPQNGHQLCVCRCVCQVKNSSYLLMVCCISIKMLFFP